MPSSPRPITIGAALVTSWLSGNGWRRSDSAVEDMFTLKPYLELASAAEAAKLDFVFRPDTQFLSEQAIPMEPGSSSLDPFTLLAAIGAHTQKIGLICTASTTFLPAYQIARQLQSLHWLSNGRAGWNLVTSLEGQKNFGIQAMPDQTHRYEKARQCLEAVQALWQSYPNKALIFNKHTGQYANSKLVKPADYFNSQVQTSGPLNTPEPPFGCPPLFQAGASPTGRDFAARYADAVFAATPDIEAGIELRQDLQQRGDRYGRSPDAIKVLPGLSLFLAPTRQEANALYQTTHSSYPDSKRFSYIEEALGIDLSSWSREQTISEEDLPELTRPVRSQTHSDLLRRFITRERPTIEELIKRPEVVGSSHWQIIGTPEDAVHNIIERMEKGAADGFIAVFGGARQSMELFFQQVIPELVQRKWFREEYQAKTLAGHLELTNSKC